MKKCILCGIMTEGSVGAAGIKWSMLCQKCKDIEDAQYLRVLRHTNEVVKLMEEING